MLFLGLLIMKNLVKPESERVMNTLRQAQLRCVMVTGESWFTSIHHLIMSVGIKILCRCCRNALVRNFSGGVRCARVGLTGVRFSAGDNILTAVNVAKSCGMVGCQERVIFVNATPHTALSVPTLTFNLEEEGSEGLHSSADVITQVGAVTDVMELM